VLLNLKTFVSSLNYSWLNLKLQAQIILTTTTLILIIVSSIASWSLTTEYSSTNINNKIVNDITSLLNDNILSLIEDNKTNEIVPLCERYYKTSTSLRFIIFIDSKGKEYGIPYSYREIFSSYDSLKPLYQERVQELKTNTLLKFDVTTLKIRVLSNDMFLGLLIVGTNSNLTLSNNITIIREIVFSIIIIIFATLFVKFTIIQPLTEVSKGLTSVANGNFSKRINLRFGGELGHLIRNFNELGRRLQLFEEKNREQLVSEKTKLESLITTSTDGALLLDTNLRIVLVNTTAFRIFGWKMKTNIVGTPIWDHLPIILQKKMFVILQDILFDTQSALFDGTIEDELNQFPKRSVRIILNIVYNSPNRHRIPIGIGITVQDRTKEVELEKTQNRFISNISHELRTPLFNIKSFIETIQEYDYTLSNLQKRYFLDIVNKETNRLTRLVNDILCISKIDSLKDVPLGRINIAETIYQTTANYQIIARDKSLHLHSEISTNELLVQGNKDLLLQVFINIVGNALKFTYPNGEIIMRAYRMGQLVIRIEVVDTGIGIISNDQQYIFQRFSRIENDVHTLKGTGLGLPIVDTILSEHKTNINVVSRSNVGSTFWFDLRVDNDTSPN
jgi:two-component system sensor histidine kinase NblS